jgi:predicted component of type VI protein secretion system
MNIYNILDAQDMVVALRNNEDDIIDENLHQRMLELIPMLYHSDDNEIEGEMYNHYDMDSIRQDYERLFQALERHNDKINEMIDESIKNEINQ